MNSQEDTTKMDLLKRMWLYGMDHSVSKNDPVTGSCEHNYEPSVSV